MNSINILPPEIKDEIEQAKKNSKAITYLIKTFLIFVTTVFVFAASYFYISLDVNGANQGLAFQEQEVSRFGTLEEESKRIAERINTIKSITRNSNKWSNVIAEIQNIMPAGVYIRTVKMEDNLKARGQIVGVAQSKNAVASLRELMEKSEKFEYVDIETSSTTADLKTGRQVETFTISFSLENGALK